MITNRPPAERTFDRLVDELAWRRSAHQRLLSALDEPDRDRLIEAWQTLIVSEPRLTTLVDLLHRQLDTFRPHDDALRPDERIAGHLGTAGYLFAALIDPIAEIADLDQLDRGLAQDYPGAGIDDLDEDAVARLLGHRAATDLADLRRLARTLAATRDAPLQARRRLPAAALRRALTPDLRRRLAAGRDDDSDDPEAVLLVVDRAGADQISWAAAQAAAQVIPAILKRRGAAALPIVLVLDEYGGPQILPFATFTASSPGASITPHRVPRPHYPARSVESSTPHEATAPLDATASHNPATSSGFAPRLDPTQWTGPIRRAVSRAGADRAVIMIIGSDRSDRVLTEPKLGGLERRARGEGWTVGLVQVTPPGPDARARVTTTAHRAATFLINHLTRHP